MTDERKVFEAWAKTHPDTDGVGAPFECESDGSYEWKWIQGMWEAWQARALLAASPAAQCPNYPCCPCESKENCQNA